MTRASDRGNAVRCVRHQIGGLLRLSPLVLAALLLVTLFWHGDSAAISGLFQSPPGETPAPEPTMTPTEAPTPEPTVTPTEAPMTVPSVTPTDAGVAEPTPTPTGTDRQRYAEGESNLEFEWGMLFDSVSLLVSYVWLCCGIIIFLAVPAFFIAVWRSSKRHQQPEE